jgi:formylmethanofuran dehydrogenase subunit B
MTETAQDERAWVDGRPVSPLEAARAAATLLAASRSAVVAGLGTDIAGAHAAVALARKIGASIDHMDANAVFANLDVMRRAGWIVTTPLQIRARADTVLLVGDGLLDAWPEMPERLGLDSPPPLDGGTRRLFHLRADFRVMTGPSAARGGMTPGSGSLLPTLAVLRALAGGRSTSLDEATVAPLRQLAAALAEARFGVAIWSAAALDSLAVEMLCGLIDDLGRKTRFAGLPLAAANNADGVTHAAAWMTGFPVRTGFAGADPVHDPWRFGAQRLIASGEADAAIWISSFSSAPPPWDNAVPTIALVPPATEFGTKPAVRFEVGCPGRDHDAMLFDPALGGIAFAAAPAPSATRSVADTVAAITASLPSC